MLNTKKALSLACCLALTLGATARAAQQTNSSAAGERGEIDEIRKVSSLIGTHVTNRADAKIADVRDLVLSPEGAVQYVVLGTGGVAGVAETYTAAPLSALDLRHVDGKWVANYEMSAEEIKKAPVIDSQNYHELTDAGWIARAEQFFRPRNEAKDRAEAPTGEHRSVGPVLLASKIRSAKLYNAQNEELAKLEDLILDRMNRVTFAIVGRGGVLGIGENYIPVPWTKLKFNTTQDAAVTASMDATKTQLEQAPLVKGSNYATLLAPGFADQVRRYFGSTTREPAASQVK